MEPGEGTYILQHVGFDMSDRPSLTFQSKGTFHYYSPLGQTLHMSFDMSERYCIGWSDISAGEAFACPDNQTLPEKYDQCAACQKRTGFNPAFYNASSVSTQQEERNQQPHFLYLAHFGPSIVKVGISYAKRGNARLLEQGARSAVILDTFPTAIIARQYEAKIAAMPGIAETIQVKKKQQLLTSRPYDSEAAARELTAIRSGISKQLGTMFTDNDILSLDSYYFPEGTPELTEAFDCSSQYRISGRVIGMLGSFLFCRYEDEIVYASVKKFTGYRVTFSRAGELTFPARQTSLF